MSIEKTPSEQIASEARPHLNPPPLHEEGGMKERPREIGGREGLEPTRYGDWEKAGRCIDF
jgi:hypothetical protein